MNKVTPFLRFNDQLEAAIEFYTLTFPDSEVRKVAPGRSFRDAEQIRDEDSRKVKAVMDAMAKLDVAELEPG